jgi:hypothetical protein
MKALPLSEAKHEIYLEQRDWAEFDAAHREPAGLADPSLYFAALCVRFQGISFGEASKEYNGMVKALGQEVVNRAIQQVRVAPRDSGGRLLAVVAWIWPSNGTRAPLRFRGRGSRSDTRHQGGSPQRQTEQFGRTAHLGVAYAILVSSILCLAISTTRCLSARRSPSEASFP